MRVFAGMAGAVLLAGCATVPGSDRLAQRDPLEGFNRVMWGVNRAADKVVLKPVTSVYRAITPRPARRGLSNIFDNLTEPFSAINALLQGRPKRAFHSLGRFAINTTIGIGGLTDNAKRLGVKPEPPEDFGQTLAVWGVNAGPYLVLPILGPSTLRDTVGSGVAQFLDPFPLCLRICGLDDVQKYGIMGAQLLDTRARLTESGADKLLDGSADSYATTRSAYLQRRRALIANQDDASEPTLDSLDPTDFEVPADGPAPAAGTPASLNPAAPTAAPEAAPADANIAVPAEDTTPPPTNSPQ